MRPRRLARLPGVADWRRFWGHLRSPTRWSALRAVVDGLVVTRALGRHPARTLIPDLTGGELDAVRAADVSAAVDAGLALLPIAPTCLRRSLTLVRELRRHDLGCALCIGVRKAGGGIHAHAWVQVGDVVVNDDPAVTSTYSRLAGGELAQVLPTLR